MYRFSRLFIALTLFCAPPLWAKALTPKQIPEPLKPWVDWVLQDVPDLHCPFFFNNPNQKQCSWPTQTALELVNQSGRFVAKWKIYQENWLTLPGDQKHWPLNVTVNNQPALVMESAGLPAIKLPAGDYEIKGEFAWDTIPDNLGIPINTGLLALTINGKTISNPAVRDGQLWLKESEVGQKKPENLQNKLDLQVFRKIIDEVPLQLLTHVSLDFSGEQREVKLAAPLLPGFLPLQINSPLPARLEPDGRLLVQLRPGHWQIEILARALNPSQTLPLQIPLADPLSKDSDSAWPQSEIWAFDARPDLRVVEIEQLTTVDPSQTNLPEDWKVLPAYTIEQGQAMAFKLIRRGDPDLEPNRLNLTRKLWLDFDGKGYTINDQIKGKMSHDWRLNVLPETQLGKVTLNQQAQLITRQDKSKTGIEVRKGVLTLNADSRYAGNVNTLSAVGWKQNFNQVNAQLNLPPGWRLFAASGVDNVPDSWIAQWTLLDLFLVLIAALAVGRLWNKTWACFALFALTITWHEPGSPHFLWLNILAASALIKVSHAERLLKFAIWYRNAFGLALVLMLIPFAINQVRLALYPQLERPWQTLQQTGQDIEPAMPQTAEEDIAALPDVEIGTSIPSNVDMPATMENRKSVNAGGAVQTESKYHASRLYQDTDRIDQQVDPKAKVQTGPGLPQWQWQRIALSWNGSVDAQQTLHLWYLTPAINMLLNFLRVISVTLLTLALFNLTGGLKLNLKPISPLLLAFALIPALLSAPEKAHADFPDPAMLAQLRAKLLEAPDCLPACAQIQQMKIAINPQTIVIALETHAQQPTAIPLPADYEQWFPNQVLIDGKPAQAMLRSGNNLWLQLDAGAHAVSLSGLTPSFSKLTLPLPLKPKQVSIEKTGWQVIGTQENYQVDDVIQFIRTQQSETREVSLAPGALPTFVKVQRTLRLGLDWQVSTQITRLSPADAAIVLAVPLLPGESVVTEGAHIKDGKIEVNLAANQYQMNWVSTLKKSEQIELTAPDSDHWTEVWIADISPIWHAEFDGLAMIHLNNEAQWLPEWHPWAGEKVILKISRPEAVEGETLTITHSHLTLKPGQRIRDLALKLNLESSLGGQHTLKLPETAILQSVAINGAIQPIRPKGQMLTLPVTPGKQEIQLNWQQAEAVAWTVSTPQVDLGTKSVNGNLTIELGRDRWVLLTMGPKIGPAVLFWGVLIISVVLAIGLGKIKLTPLKPWHWWLLLLGLSQLPVVSAALVIAWLLALGWRSTDIDITNRRFNALQVALVCLTFLALGQLFAAVAQGLLGSPDMQIAGNQSTALSLHWYQDRNAAVLPSATVISIPLISYRLLMLAWSLWLAFALLNWVKWGWACFAKNGIWRKTVSDQFSSY